MPPLVKRILLSLAGLVVVGIASLLAYALPKIRAYDQSMARVYDIAPPPLSRSSDPALIARGKHLVESLGACATRDCHGTDLGGGKTIDLGPVGLLSGPNLANGLLLAYSDGELARMLMYGLKRDGTSLRMMPVQDFNWLPDSDIIAMVSYLRTIPSVERPNGPNHVGALGKILDRRDEFVMDVARRSAKPPRAVGPAPSPTAEYGRFVVRLCTGCHGESLSGGRIPGAPPSLPIPSNLTPDASGLREWSYEDFTKLLNTGVRKNGLALNPFMPYEAWAKLDDVEKRALWAYLRAVPAKPLGQR
jgi:cytochrome c553